MHSAQTLTEAAAHGVSASGPATQARSASRARGWITLCVVLCATVLAYSRTLGFDFVYDDVSQIKGNPRLTAWAYLPHYFTEHLWIHDRLAAADFYRPLFLVWLRLQYALFGLHPAGWHAFSVALHCAVTLLVYAVARQLGLTQRAAVLATLIFGLSSLHVESVSWISGTTDPLAAVFLLTALFFLLEHQRSSFPAHMAGAWLCFTGALLCKETAIAFPLIAVAALAFTGTWQLRGRTLIIRSAPYFLISGIYLFWRHHVLGGLAHTGTASRNLHSIYVILLNQPRLLWFYTRHLLVPVRLSGFYDFPVTRTWSFSAVFLPALAVLLMWASLILAVRRFRRHLPLQEIPRGLLALGLVWIAASLAPVLDISRLKPSDYVHDRYLYLASIGFCLIAGALVSGLAESIALAKRTSQILVSVLTVVLIAACLAETAVWQNDETLYLRALAAAPRNQAIRNNLAAYLMDHSEISRAVPLLQEAVSADPRNLQAHVNLADCYEVQGELEKSEQQWILADQLQGDPEIKANLERIRRLRAARITGSAPTDTNRH